jgi:hypothetical protein
VAIERCSHLAEPLRGELSPIGELVVSVPAPRCDHGEHEDPALREQVLIGCRVVLAGFLGRMGDVELDGSADHSPEVDEQRSALRVEQVSRMRLSVQQLLVSPAVGD